MRQLYQSKLSDTIADREGVWLAVMAGFALSILRSSGADFSCLTIGFLALSAALSLRTVLYAVTEPFAVMRSIRSEVLRVLSAMTVILILLGPLFVPMMLVLAVGEMRSTRQLQQGSTASRP